MAKMYIKSVDFDGEQEADILVSDGKYEILCYALPYSAGDKEKDFTLSAFMSENVMRALKNEYSAEKTDGYYGYKLTGRLFDLKNRLVAVGGIVIELENNIPKDIAENEFVEFEVGANRLDGHRCPVKRALSRSRNLCGTIPQSCCA